MDMAAISQLISTIGFPIAVCLICFWYINKMQEQHSAEIGELTKALNNNTLVMRHLADVLGVDADTEPEV
jgi:hypothetical protein|nr:MAG TPA: YvrJ protein family protein [Caudoviricetes sp.]